MVVSSHERRGMLGWCARVQSDAVKRSQWERYLAQFMCQVFVASWTGVVR